jgi:hypothetical protein
MDDKIPCCMIDAARKVKRIMVGNSMVGISHLDSVFAEVEELKLNDENRIKNELLVKIRKYNYIPPAAESEYSNAMYEEYQKYLKEK